MINPKSDNAGFDANKSSGSDCIELISKPPARRAGRTKPWPPGRCQGCAESPRWGFRGFETASNHSSLMGWKGGFAAERSIQDVQLCIEEEVLKSNVMAEVGRSDVVEDVAGIGVVREVENREGAAHEVLLDERKRQMFFFSQFQIHREEPWKTVAVGRAHIILNGVHIGVREAG